MSRAIIPSEEQTKLFATKYQELAEIHAQLHTLLARRNKVQAEIRQIRNDVGGYKKGGRPKGVYRDGSLYHQVVSHLDAEPGKTWKAAELAEQIGRDRRTVTSAFKKLVADGRIRRVARGQYKSCLSQPLEPEDQETVAPLSRLQRRCRDLVETLDAEPSKVWSTQQLVEMIGVSRRHCESALTDLVAGGHIRRVKPGAYTSVKNEGVVGRQRGRGNA